MGALSQSTVASFHSCC